jgi:trehalose 6-phosphate synthase
MTDRVPLLIASNRGPIAFAEDDRGELVPHRGSGGLVTALTGALSAVGGTWIAAALTDGDRAVLERSADGVTDIPEERGGYRVRYLDIAPETFANYYNGVSNGMLWFVHHYLWDTVRSPAFGGATETLWQDYVAVNRRFAEALAQEGRRRRRTPRYLVQDYHLSLVPRFLRELQPDAPIAHFSHTPFAGSTYLRVLPDRIRIALLRGMLGADILGFHSEAWAQNFLVSCRYVAGARVDLARSRVVIDGREVLVRVYPISVDAEAMRAKAASPEIRVRRERLERWRGDAKLLLRVDRFELTKNVRRGFQAYEEFLRTSPSWRGRVKFLAFLAPSREAVPEYRAYAKECLEEAERVNRAFGRKNWTPIETRVKDDFEAALAAYGLYDVLMVNPIFDGMNLVAMEGPLVNRRHGVLILSRNAGAHSRLGRYALGINPFDIGEMADAIATAIHMPEDERARRARGLSRLVLANPPARWINRQLEDLDRVAERRAAG